MIRNYIKTAIRSLRKNKLFSFINIFGLALSMSVCLVVMMVIANAFTYDNFHPFPERTYRIISDATADNGLHDRWGTSPLPLANQLQKKFPFVEKTVRVYNAISDEVSFKERKIQLKGAFAEPSFLNVFGFKLVAGDRTTAFEKPYTVVLAKRKADLLFPNGDAIGKVIRFKNFDADFIITGILKDGYKTLFDNDLYVSFSSLPGLIKQKKISVDIDNWKNYGDASTYVLLKKNTSILSLKNALQKIAITNVRLFPIANIKQLKYDYQRLDHITPGEALINGGNTVTSSLLFVISGIAFVILLLACFNYTNLSIARSLTRAREVGVRKVLGGSRKQLFLQFIIESVVVAVTALILACLLLQIMLGYSIAERLLAGIHPSYYLALWFIPFAIFTGLLAGSLPAWILSAFKPVDVMKGIVSVKLFKSFRLHQVLIALQFSVSLLFIVFLITIYKQTIYLKSFSYGFDQKNIVDIPVTDKNINLLKTQILRIPGVEHVSATSAIFGFNSSDFSLLKKDNNKDGIGTDSYFIDENVIQNMGLKLVAGTNFPITTLSKEAYVILNEKAVKALNFHNAFDAVGKLIWLNDSTQVQVSGVVKDFYYLNPKHELGNLALRYNAKEFKYINIKVTEQNRAAVIKAIQSTWKKLYNNEPFNYKWFDDELRQARDKHEDFSLIAFLAVMAITISCMGLLGIVTYSSEIRQKEVSIRKVMGAEVKSILYLISKDFVLLLVFACLFTLPLGYIIGNTFLNEFANRIAVGWEILAGSTFIIMLIGLLTILPQTLKAALANPVKSLRSE